MNKKASGTATGSQWDLPRWKKDWQRKARPGAFVTATRPVWRISYWCRRSPMPIDSRSTWMRFQSSGASTTIVSRWSRSRRRCRRTSPMWSRASPDLPTLYAKELKMQFSLKAFLQRACRTPMAYGAIAAALLFGTALVGCQTNLPYKYKAGYDKRLTADSWATRAPDDALVIIG